jgi:hypothetical protein
MRDAPPNASIARDLVEHFENRLAAMDGEAMVVVMSRRIAVELHGELGVSRMIGYTIYARYRIMGRKVSQIDRGDCVGSNPVTDVPGIKRYGCLRNRP